jgi:uncharacterized protein with PIN domain
MRDQKFIVTRELGKLAKWLRILGYDSVYHDKKETSSLIIRALREERILLTRSPALEKYKGIRVVIVGHDLVEDQLEQVARELGLPVDDKEMFRRCVECNTLLELRAKEDVRDKVPEYVFNTQECFKICPRCGKIFWKGTHWDMVKEWLDRTKK